jgi:hypothetical protein
MFYYVASHGTIERQLSSSSSSSAAAAAVFLRGHQLKSVNVKTNKIMPVRR